MPQARREFSADSVQYDKLPLEHEEVSWPGKEDLRFGWTLLDRQKPDRSTADIARLLGEFHRRRPFYLKQVHRTDLVLLKRDVSTPAVPLLADGMLTDRQDVLLGVNVADCVPLFVRAAGVFGVLHAGWRGVVGGILPVALKSLHQHLGQPPQEAELVIGPGIGPCCFEVSASVWALFEARHRQTRGTHLYVDLAAAIESQWVQLGGRPKACHRFGRCTVCSQPVMHSFRRDHTSGRNYAFIYSR